MPATIRAQGGGPVTTRQLLEFEQRTDSSFIRPPLNSRNCRNQGQMAKIVIFSHESPSRIAKQFLNPCQELPSIPGQSTN